MGVCRAGQCILGQVIGRVWTVDVESREEDKTRDPICTRVEEAPGAFTGDCQRAARILSGFMFVEGSEVNDRVYVVE